MSGRAPSVAGPLAGKRPTVSGTAGASVAAPQGREDRKSAPPKDRLRQRAEREFLNRQLVHGRGSLAASVAFGVLGTAAVVVTAYATAAAVAGVVVDGRSLPEISGWLWLFAGTLVLRALFGYAQELAASRAAVAVKRGVRRRAVQRLAGSRRDPDGRPLATGATAAVLVEGVEKLEGYYGRFVPLVALAGVAPLLMLAVIFPVNWVVGTILLLSAPLIPLYMALVGLGAEDASRRQFDSLRRLSGYFLDRLQGLPTLRRLGYAEREPENIRRASESLGERTMKVLRIAFLSSTVLEFFATFSIAIAATYVGLALLGWIDFGGGAALSLRDGLFLLLLAPAYFQPLRDFAAAYHDRADALAAAGDLMGLLDAPESADSPEGPARNGAGVPGPLMPPTIELRGATVRYAGRKTPALDGATLRVPAAGSVALTGPSGGGKSTLLGLVAGQVLPTEGEALVGGRAAAEVPAQATAWVGQRPYLFPATVRENIAFGQPEKTEAEIEAAARAARVLDFAKRLPDGLDTRLGERGSGISGGEAQRVALARAFLKDAPVVLLDEPTANLDAETERELVETIGALIRGRTALVCTHRAPLAALCDRTVRVEDGRVLEVSGDGV